MSRIDELIKEKCPDGVEYKKVKEVATLSRGKRVTRKDLSETGAFPVYQNSLKPLGFYDESNYPENTTFVICAGAAGEIGFSETAYWGADDCFSILCSEDLDSRYVYHWMLNSQPFIKSNVRKASIPRLSHSVVESMQIPVPPLEVQREIVQKLDCFEEYKKALVKESDMRVQQFSYYSRFLFDDLKDNCNRYPLSKICSIVKGKTPIQKAIPGEYPLVVTTTERKTSTEYQFDKPSVCIPLVSSRGHGVASLNHVYYQEGKFALGNILCAVTPFDEQILDARFLYYYLEETKDYVLVPLMKGGANVALRIDDIEKVNIPVPPLITQKRIVEVLDTFNRICGAEGSAISAEIEARQKQYEYYRDKLLTFKEKEA